MIKEFFIKNKHNTFLINICIYLFFIFIAIINYLLLINTHTILSQGDIAFHFRRILELKQSLLHGEILPRFSFNQYHGSLIMTLYPYINLYPIALLSILIKSKIILLYIWYIGNSTLLLVLSFYSCYLFDKSFFVSILFSLIYGESVMCFTNGLDDFGLITSFSLFPLVMFGSFELINNDKYIELSLGLSLIIFSHVLSSLIAAVFVISWLLINVNLINLKKIILLFKSCILILCLTSIIWIPVVVIKVTHNVKLYTPTNSSHFNNGINLTHIIGGAMIDNLTLHPNIFVLLSIISVLAFYKYYTIMIRKICLLSLLFIICGMNLVSWKSISHFMYSFLVLFQGPSRFFIIPQILMSYVFAVIIVKYYKNSKINKLNFYLIILFMSIFDLYTLHVFIETRQNTYAIIILIISIVLIICLILYNKEEPINKILFFTVGLLTIILQIDAQQQEISMHFQQGHLITKQYFYSHIKDKDSASWLDWINNSNQFKYLISYSSYPTYDYYPESSINVSCLINRNKALYKKSKILTIKHVGYNKFEFNNKKNIKKLALPIVDYGGVSHRFIQLYFNHSPVVYHSNKYNMMTINNVNKGFHIVQIRDKINVGTICIEVFLILVGIIWLILVNVKFR